MTFSIILLTLSRPTQRSGTETGSAAQKNFKKKEKTKTETREAQRLAQRRSKLGLSWMARQPTREAWTGRPEYSGPGQQAWRLLCQPVWTGHSLCARPRAESCPHSTQSSFTTCLQSVHCCCSFVKSCPALCSPMDCGPPTRVGCHVLLQGIFPTQGSNLHLPHLLN